MAWGLLGDWNSTLLTHIWDSLVDRVWEETESLTRIVFDKIILPAGQALLNTTEAAVQYTLNGEYEVKNTECWRLNRAVSGFLRG